MLVEDEFKRRRRALAQQLRNHRLERGFSGYVLADKSGISQSKISKIERERLTPSVADVTSLAEALRLSADMTARLRLQARDLATEWVEIRSESGALQAECAQQRMKEIELIAQTIEVFAIHAVPSLLQIENYTRALFESSLRLDHEPQDLNRHVVLRKERQAQLADYKKQYRFLLLESALRVTYGSGETLRRQVVHLMNMRQPNVELRVLPFDVPTPINPYTTFAIIDGRLAVNELPTSDVYVQGELDVLEYRKVFDQIWEAALAGDSLQQLLECVEFSLRQYDATTGAFVPSDTDEPVHEHSR